MESLAKTTEQQSWVFVGSTLRIVSCSFWHQGPFFDVGNTQLYSCLPWPHFTIGVSITASSAFHLDLFFRSSRGQHRLFHAYGDDDEQRLQLFYGACVKMKQERYE